MAPERLHTALSLSSSKRANSFHLRNRQARTVGDIERAFLNSIYTSAMRVAPNFVAAKWICISIQDDVHADAAGISARGIGLIGHTRKPQQSCQLCRLLC
jgi:hypothetical protein